MLDPIFHLPPFVMAVLLLAACFALVSLIGSFFQTPRRLPPSVATPGGAADQRCATCSATNPSFAKFCRQCGRRL